MQFQSLSRPTIADLALLIQRLDPNPSGRMSVEMTEKEKKIFQVLLIKKYNFLTASHLCLLDLISQCFEF